MEEQRESTLRSRKPRLKVIKGSKTEPPKPVNILTSIRKTTFQLSHAEMSKRMGISKHALIRLEQGTFDRILPTVLAFMLNNTHYSELLLVDAYEDFQNTVRSRHMRYFDSEDSPNQFVFPRADVHPLVQLRAERNLAQVAKDLCLPYATLRYFEHNYKQQKSVPKQMVNVLKQIGYSDEEIFRFKLAYHEFRVEMGCNDGRLND